MGNRQNCWDEAMELVFTLLAPLFPRWRFLCQRGSPLRLHPSVGFLLRWQFPLTHPALPHCDALCTAFFERVACLRTVDGTHSQEHIRCTAAAQLSSAQLSSAQLSSAQSDKADGVHRRTHATPLQQLTTRWAQGALQWAGSERSAARRKWRSRALARPPRRRRIGVVLTRPLLACFLPCSSFLFPPPLVPFAPLPFPSLACHSFESPKMSHNPVLLGLLSFGAGMLAHSLLSKGSEWDEWLSLIHI